MGQKCENALDNSRWIAKINMTLCHPEWSQSSDQGKKQCTVFLVEVSIQDKC